MKMNLKLHKVTYIKNYLLNKRIRNVYIVIKYGGLWLQEDLKKFVTFWNLKLKQLK